MTYLKKDKKSGFTLIELLIVIAIIAILISIGLASFSRVQKSSRDSQRRADLKNIQGALEQYYADNNAYPNSLDNLTSGTIYIKEIPTPPISSLQPAGYVIHPGGGQTYCVGAFMETEANDKNCAGTNYGYVITNQD